MVLVYRATPSAAGELWKGPAELLPTPGPVLFLKDRAVFQASPQGSAFPRPQEGAGSFRAVSEPMLTTSWPGTHHSTRAWP